MRIEESERIQKANLVKNNVLPIRTEHLLYFHTIHRLIDHLKNYCRPNLPSLKVTGKFYLNIFYLKLLINKTYLM